jgi:uncharacterized phage protein gp47/JayE
VGVAAVDVAATCTETGPVIGRSGSIVNIETPVAGWAGVTNLTDATEGVDIESNEDLRIRREVELATPGSSPIDALRAELAALDDVTAVTVFMNTTDATDADGVPPHSVECLVRGGTNQDIFDQLLRSVAAGFATSGDVTGTATDSEGNVHAVAFSRPEEIEVYVVITGEVVEGEYPEDGEEQVQDAIVEYGDAQRTGKNAVASAIGAQPFRAGVPGWLDTVTCYIGTAPAPGTSTTIQVSPRQLAVFDTSRITVATTNGVP